MPSIAQQILETLILAKSDPRQVLRDRAASDARLEQELFRAELQQALEQNRQANRLELEAERGKGRERTARVKGRQKAREGRREHRRELETLGIRERGKGERLERRGELQAGREEARDVRRHGQRLGEIAARGAEARRTQAERRDRKRETPLFTPAQFRSEIDRRFLRVAEEQGLYEAEFREFTDKATPEARLAAREEAVRRFVREQFGRELPENFGSEMGLFRELMGGPPPATGDAASRIIAEELGVE